MASGNIPTTTQNTPKKRLSFAELWNMSFGFFGIQFGFALQNANVSRIFQTLGAELDNIAILWIAAPVTGLLVQPIVGYMSDRTWHPKWGRRRPYFLVGAILSSIALVFMPHSPALWMAAGLLWILDTFGNVAMEPFRALVADKLPDSQLNRGFVMQSLLIGLGGSIASALPWLMKNVFGLENTAAKGIIADNVKFSFYVGAFFFLSSVLYTVFTTKEYPPTEREAENQRKSKGGILHGLNEIGSAIKNMPPRMRIIALVQFFTWPGLFLLWFYYSVAVAYNVFGATTDTDPA
ncbi:MAG TPA: MFS transporter, partial [Chitinophagaceae bacterium]|nr:MFS transporter [Chitinophagaceae bacterium]